ncbi:MAG TPA: lipid-A-disaccharide synthase [Rhizomicrobium sp.]
MPTDPPARIPTLMLVCGEPSGDQLGAELMIGLKAVAGPSLNIVGVGGPAMTAQGLTSLFPLDETAVMGLREVVPRIPAILRRVREVSDYALALKPDAVVLIDSPDFTHRIAQRIKRMEPSIPTVNYVAPQVWASRQYRARKMARYFDLVLALLPFEVPFFETYGLRAAFVGHPAVERVSRMTGGEALRKRLGINQDTRLLAVMPGSRMNEVRLLLPGFREAVALVAKEFGDLVCVLPLVSHVGNYVRQTTANWPVPLHFVDGDNDKFAAFEASDVALAASGTVTIELALARTPMVVAYRLGWLTFALARPFIRTRFITMANVILGRAAVPEFVQGDCNGEALATALLALLRDPAACELQRHALDEAMAKLGVGGEAPSLRAARALLDFLRSRRS